MIYIMFFILGCMIMYLFLQKPLQFTIHHIHENKTEQLSRDEIRNLEEEMNKPDPKQDSFEQNINEAINNIDEIMGGSDR